MSVCRKPLSTRRLRNRNGSEGNLAFWHVHRHVHAGTRNDFPLNCAKEYARYQEAVGSISVARIHLTATPALGLKQANPSGVEAGSGGQLRSEVFAVPLP